jgi:glycerol-3-phosphate dehydrogenase
VVIPVTIHLFITVKRSRMHTSSKRAALWSILSLPWDLIVIGGGITGAGVLRAACAAGLRALLIEAEDFSCGTSSRSSKLVHGGFRYLRNHQFNVTYESVKERQHLLAHAPPPDHPAALHDALLSKVDRAQPAPGGNDL